MVLHHEEECKLLKSEAESTFLKRLCTILNVLVLVKSRRVKGEQTLNWFKSAENKP